MKRKLTQADFPIGSTVTIRKSKKVIGIAYRYRGQVCEVIGYPTVDYWLKVRAENGAQFVVLIRRLSSNKIREVKRPKPAPGIAANCPAPVWRIA
ncbi:MAG: hypothetical protein WC455_26310 [Dehalococcoidia bacterium]